MTGVAPVLEVGVSQAEHGNRKSLHASRGELRNRDASKLMLLGSAEGSHVLDDCYARLCAP
jgi:hypothetical protein